MPVNSIVTSLQNDTAAAQTGRKANNEMDKNAFLSLLVAQLRYQDPLEPTNNQEFGAQLAQFSQLEQLQNMSQSIAMMTLQQSYNLVGKYVIAETRVKGELVQVPGIVDAIFTQDGKTYAQIGEYPVLLSSITDVIDSSDFINPKTLIDISSNLMGRWVKGEYKETTDVTDDEGNVTGTKATQIYVEGLVKRVAMEEGVMYAYVDGGDGGEKKVPVGGIYDISMAPAFVPTPEPEPEPEPTPEP